MIGRGTIIAVLLVIELAIVGEAGVVIHGGRPAPSPGQRAASGARLVEDGPHQVFGAGAHPALTVDIGYADLTILAGETSQVDVSLRASTAYGVLRARAPITARADGETIDIATADAGGWSTGDNRRVIVRVPPGTKVTVVDAGDIQATGLRAEASFKSIGRGSVTLDDYAAPALRIASNGRIGLHRIVAAHLDATSDDGRVDGTEMQVRDGSIESDGRVTLGLAAGTDTLVTAETSAGRISVSGFPAAASPTTSRTSGDDGADEASSRTVRVGAGNGHLDVHASDGDIIVAAPPG